MKHRTSYRSETCSFWPLENIPCLKLAFTASNTTGTGRTYERGFKFARLAEGASSAGLGIYTLICPSCPAEKKCAEVRIDNKNFHLTPRQRKKLEAFKTVADITENKPYGSKELQTLFDLYERNRHDWGKDYSDTDISNTFTTIVDNNAKIFTAISKATDKIMAAAFIDEDGAGNIHGDVLIYDLAQSVARYSPGISMLLHIASIAQQRHPEGKFYLGSLSPESPKLGYKSQFRGLEYFYNHGWSDVSPANHLKSAQARAFTS